MKYDLPGMVFANFGMVPIMYSLVSLGNTISALP